VDRRRQTDFWAGLLFKLNILSWALLLWILLVFHRAQPEFETLFDRFYHLSLRTSWDIQYLYYLTILAGSGIVISLFGLVLGFYRGRRRDDHKKALLMTGLISAILLVFCVFII
jgi:hypothetical protein